MELLATLAASEEAGFEPLPADGAAAQPTDTPTRSVRRGEGRYGECMHGYVCMYVGPHQRLWPGQERPAQGRKKRPPTCPRTESDLCHTFHALTFIHPYPYPYQCQGPCQGDIAPEEEMVLASVSLRTMSE